MRTCEYGVYNPRTRDVDPCGKKCEGDTDFCGSHNRLIRKQETDSVKAIEKRNSQIAKQKAIQFPKTTKAIRKVSLKRAEINKEYFKLVEQFKKDNPECKAKVNEYCTGKTEDSHHMRGRGEFLLDTSTWLPTCRSCHSYIEAHPKEAKEKGWSESRLATNYKTDDPFLREAWAVGYTHVSQDRVKNEIVFYGENIVKRFDYHEFITFASGLKLIRAMLMDGTKYSWISDANGDGDRFRNYLKS